MTGRPTNEYAPDRVSPPGETLGETLEALGMTQAELASRLGRARKTVNEIIKGKAALEPETALQLESVLGTPAAFWMEREARYRESLARQTRTRRLVAGVDWARQFPFADMAKLGWVPADTPRADRVAVLLRFFGVASTDAWQDLWRAREVAFRRSLHRHGRQGAIAAWLRRGEIEAQALDCAPFDRERFLAALATARSLTREEPEVFQPRLIELFAAGGLALVWVPELEGAPISGATRWLSEQRALIQLSLRYKSDDQLFFSLFHEAAHVLLHPKKAEFLEGAGQDTPEEREADRFAANHLIPPGEYERLKAAPLSVERIKASADRIGIAPGIVVGRLQHDGHIPFHEGNGLKRRLLWLTAKREPA
jgi:HTH-type transcriptional regulator / antitoxin HigA